MTDALIQTDHPLTERQREYLNVVLALIVPAAPERGLPAGSEVGVLEYIRAHSPDVLPEIAGQLDELDAVAQAGGVDSFGGGSASEQQGWVEQLRAADGSFLRRLAQQTMACYYQHDQVLLAIGMPARPPYPEGNEVVSGDLSLLDPVIARGKVYRDA